jgi:hypothetical protein
MIERGYEIYLAYPFFHSQRTREVNPLRSMRGERFKVTGTEVELFHKLQRMRSLEKCDYTYDEANENYNQKAQCGKPVTDVLGSFPSRGRHLRRLRLNAAHLKGGN